MRRHFLLMPPDWSLQLACPLMSWEKQASSISLIECGKPGHQGLILRIGIFDCSSAHHREQCLRLPFTELLIRPLLAHCEWDQILERSPNPAAVFRLKAPQVNSDIFAEPGQ